MPSRALDDPHSEITPAMLREARTTAGLTQAAAALIARVDPQTISRWERGERKPSHAEASWLLDLYRRHELGEQPRPHVPGDTAPAPQRLSESAGRYSALPAHLEAIALAFEREALRAGASDDEVDYLSAMLRLPEAGRVFWSQRLHMTTDDQVRQYSALVDGLRSWLTQQIGARRGRESALPGGARQEEAVPAPRHADAKKRRASDRR